MPKINPNTLRKLNLYRQNPDIVQPLTNGELADLVVVVLGQVDIIDKAIKDGRLDGVTPVEGKDFVGRTEATKMLADAVNSAIAGFDSKMAKTGSQLEKQVQEALANIRSGDNGIVTEEEIGRAARMALELIELPDFEAMVQTEITTDGFAVRDALELLNGDDKLEQSAVKDLKEDLEKLWTEVMKKGATGGVGGTSKPAVYRFIKDAIADGTIGSGGGATTFLALTDTPASYAGEELKVVRVNAAGDALEFNAPSSGGNAQTADPLSQFAATTLAQLNGVISDATLGDSSDFATAAQGTKVDFLTVTQAVNLDTMESDIAALANGMVYKGDWDASAGTFPGSAAAQTGWFYYVSVAGTVDSVAFAVGDNIVAVTDNASTSTFDSNWSKHDQTDAVQSVVGITGSVSKSGLLSALNVADGATPDQDLSALAPIANPTFTGEIGIGSVNVSETELGILEGLTASTAELNKMDGVTATTAEINFVDGVTSNVQTQLNAKAEDAADVGLGNVDNTSNATERAATATLTNKRITRREQTVASASTVTPHWDNDDIVTITAQAVGLTLANPAGTPTDGQPMVIRILDNATGRTIAVGSQYRAIGVTIPTTTTASKTIYLGGFWNVADSKFDITAVAEET